MSKYILSTLVFISCLDVYARPKVFIIDTGVNKKVYKYITGDSPSKRGDIDYYTRSHGSHIASIIVNNATCEIEIESCDYFENRYKYYICLERAIKSNADIVNMSLAGYIEDEREEALVKRLLASGKKIYAAVGNNSKDLDKLKERVFPASYEGVTAVENIAQSSNHLKKAIKINGQDILGKDYLNNEVVMSGSSQATAILTGRDICKH